MTNLPVPMKHELSLIGIPEVMLLAARKFESGEWAWNDGSRPDDDLDRGIFLAVCGTAAELGKYDLAYEALIALRSYLDQPWGPWNDAKGRTLDEVIGALKGCAARHQHRVAA